MDMINRENLNEKLWAMFILEEEAHLVKDEHGRVLSKSVNFDPIIPIVSIKQYENGFYPIWPNGKRFAVCLTHDVDWAYPPRRHFKRAVNEARRRLAVHKELMWRFGSLTNWKFFNPYSILKIARIEKEFSATSTFMIKATPLEQLNARYEEYYEVEFLAGELTRLIDEGWDAGLHAGYSSHDNPDRLSKERAILQRALNGYPIRGVRMHYLRFSYPDTWLAVEKAGFVYDSTLGFPDHPGFRNGMCYPFRPVINGRRLALLEIPLAVMDTTFWGYMHVNVVYALELVKKIASVVEKIGGVLTLLWHNNTFCDLLYGDWGRMYKSLLKYFASREAWLTNCLNIYEYWSSHYDL